MPFENEFSCDLIDSKQFDHFRRQDRDHNGKKYQAVIAWKEGKGSKDQGYRYHKDIWTEDQAKEHCKAHKGTFHALKEIKGGDNMPVNKKKFDKIQKQHFKEYQETGKETGKVYRFVSPGEMKLTDDHLVDIEILREGSWKHKEAPNGVLVLTKDKLREFIANFKDKIVGSELPLDLGHEVKAEGAIGWLRDMWIKAKDGLDHLWARLDITDPKIQEKIKEGSLKYFSPSLNFGFEDPETGNKFDLIRAGALTNYPYLKGMSPAIVNFSEISPGKVTLERENGNKVHLLEKQVSLLKSLWLQEEKENKELKKDKQTLALELRMSELGSEGRITPSEKFTVRELTKESHNAGLIALRVFEARVNPVVTFGQKSEVMSERQVTTVKDLIELSNSDDKGIREKAMAELTERFDRQQQKKGGK